MPEQAARENDSGPDATKLLPTSAVNRRTDHRFATARASAREPDDRPLPQQNGSPRSVVKLIIEDYEARASTYELAEQYNLRRNTVCDTLRRAGFDVSGRANRPIMDEQQKAEARELSRTAATRQELMGRLGAANRLSDAFSSRLGREAMISLQIVAARSGSQLSTAIAIRCVAAGRESWCNRRSLPIRQPALRQLQPRHEPQTGGSETPYTTRAWCRICGRGGTRLWTVEDIRCRRNVRSQHTRPNEPPLRLLVSTLHSPWRQASAL